MNADKNVRYETWEYHFKIIINLVQKKNEKTMNYLNHGRRLVKFIKT